MRDDDLVGSDEASRITGIPRSTFMRHVADGYIEYVQQMPGVSGAMLFRRSYIETISAASIQAARLRARLEKAEAAS